MDRRSFLGAMAGAAVSTASFAASLSKPHIGIVGGGIVGAAIAMRCAQAGADVTLLERVEPAAGATSKSLAWINAFMDDDYYSKMRLVGIERWREVDRALGIGVIWGGYLNFTDREVDRGRMAKQAAQFATAGHPMRAVDAVEIQRISPALQPGRLVEAIYSDSGGHVDPVAATRRFLEAAKQAGAKVLFPHTVTAIEPSAKGVNLVSNKQRLRFDHVLIASGVDAPAMVAPLGYTMPLVHSPGALVHTKPLPIMTRLVYDGPDILEWKQAADGTVVGLEASLPPALPMHAEIRERAMVFPPGVGERHGARILSKLSTYMPGLAQAQVARVTLGFRPMPKDGFPIVGPVPGVPRVSVCVTHSGVTLAPLLGDLVAAELMTGRAESLLAPYRPARYA